MWRVLRIGVLALAAVAGLVAGPYAQTTPAHRGFFWKVEREGRTGWLAGSLHMLPPDAYPLPPAMTAAFDASRTLLEEADPEELASPAFAVAIAGRAMYLDGQTLDQRLSPETFQLIAERAEAAGLSVDVLRRMKPWMAATTLQVFELQRGGFDPALGLDVHFHRLARQSGKAFLALESGLEQVAVLESIGPSFEDALVRSNLQSAAAEVNEMRRLADAWRSGDIGTLERIVLSGVRDTPEVYEALIARRNRNWLPKVRACLDTSTCFIVVGAGHLVGDDGLVAALEAMAYTVTQR